LAGTNHLTWRPGVDLHQQSSRHPHWRVRPRAALSSTTPMIATARMPMTPKSPDAARFIPMRLSRLLTQSLVLLWRDDLRPHYHGRRSCGPKPQARERDVTRRTQRKCSLDETPQAAAPPAAPRNATSWTAVCRRRCKRSAASPAISPIRHVTPVWAQLVGWTASPRPRVVLPVYDQV
jgi:hypothetical protein